MKGITPVVSIILLLFITISVLGFSFLFFQNITTTSGSQAEQAAIGQTNKVLQTAEIVAVEDGRITIKNTGTHPIKASDVAVFIDGQVAPLMNPGDIEPGRAATYILQITDDQKKDYDGTKTVEVSVPGNKAIKVAEVYPLQTRLVFVTSVSFNGNLGSYPQANGKTGIDAGDEICKTLADSSTLQITDGTYPFRQRKWVAWLSDSLTDPRDRIRDTSYHVMQIDYTKITVGNKKEDLTDGTLSSQIINTENGGLSNVFVWTGTDSTGSKKDTHCNEWADNDPGSFGTAGRTAFTNYAWTDFSTQACNVARRIYCFEK